MEKVCRQQPAYNLHLCSSDGALLCNKPTNHPFASSGRIYSGSDAIFLRSQGDKTAQATVRVHSIQLVERCCATTHPASSSDLFHPGSAVVHDQVGGEFDRLQRREARKWQHGRLRNFCTAFLREHYISRRPTLAECDLGSFEHGGFR